MTDPHQSPPTARRLKKKRYLGRKVLLSLASLALVLGLLEVAARLFVPVIGPVLVRPGFYDNPLPLVTGTGGRPGDFKVFSDQPTLAPTKRAGEIRIAMLGESSVAGSPFSVDLSPPSMLKDLLSARFPGRDLTVVNMGRPASVATNVYYYLLFLRRFAPDYIVFYMGMNDSEVLPGEQCALGNQPRIYAAWRTLVERSWFLWLTRTYGVQVLWKLAGVSDWYPLRDCPVKTFSLWTDLLVRTAVQSGAHVVAASPVVSGSMYVEPDYAGGVNSERSLDPAYRELLACALTPACDFPARLRAELEAREAPRCDPERLDHVACVEYGPAQATMLDVMNLDLDARATAWENATRRWGGDFVPFHRLLGEASPGRLLASAYFTDRQHLTPEGYHYLAALIAERIAARLEGTPVRDVPVSSPEDVAVYVRRSASTGLDIEFEQLVRGWFLSAVPGLQYTARTFTGPACTEGKACDRARLSVLALGWLRSRAGLDAELPPDLADRLTTFNPRAVLDDLERAKNAPSGGGGPGTPAPAP